MTIETPVDAQSVESLLRAHGVTPTSQRVLVLCILFSHGSHVSAEELHQLVSAQGARVSKATIYNTLALLAEKGLIRPVIADPERVFYDPNTTPHHHLYDEATGKLTDIEATDIQVTKLPPLPEDSELKGVDVVVRVRRADKTTQ